MLVPAQLPVLAALIRNAYPAVVAVYLYGSYAKGCATPSSDVDVCVLMPADSHIARHDYVLNAVLSQHLQLDVHVVFCTKHNGWCVQQIA